MRFTRLAVAVILASGACHNGAVEPTVDSGPAQVYAPTAYDVSPPLRELAKLPRIERKENELGEMEEVMPNPHLGRLSRAPVGPSKAASIVQDHFGAFAIPAPTANFEGQGAGLANTNIGGFPPDTDGAVGPNHYMQIVNTSLAIFSKTGTVMMGPMDTSQVWSGFAGICSTNGFGDGVVKYDQLADRWVISQFAFAFTGGAPKAPFIQCIAISTSPDPTGTYTRYQFSFNSDLNDYPKIAMWPDGYYITYNMFANAQNFSTSRVCAMDRVKMIAGDANATTQCFDTGPNFFGLLVADLDGKTQPATGQPAHVIALDSSTDLAYWQLHVDFTTPANSTLSATPQMITITDFTPYCKADPQCQAAVTTPNSTEPLDSLADRAMNRFVYRRFADHEAMLLSHSVQIGNTATPPGGVRWYELRNGATPTVFQSGTFQPDATVRWMPSIAMDASGDIALGYTQASSALNPAIKYTARQPSDAPGTMGFGEGTLMAGTATQQTNGGNRWGDYASVNIDPADDCTFWLTHEYYATGNNVWSTRIGSFVLPTCSAFDVKQPDPESVPQGGSMTYTITTATTAGAAQSVALSTTGLPAGVTATFAPASVQSGNTTQITLTADATAALGTTNYQLVGTGASAMSMDTVALTVTAPMIPPDAPGGDGSESAGCCSVAGGSSPVEPTILFVGVGFVIARRRRRRRV
jgi:hypothetical protein